MDYSTFADFADSKMATVLVTTFTMVGVVVIGTIVCALVAIYLIESLEAIARSVRQWLKKPSLWA